MTKKAELLTMNRTEWKALSGLLMLMPTASMLTVGILYLWFYWSYPLDLLESVLESFGFKFLPEWLVFTVILVGPVFAFCLNASAISRVRFETTKEKCDCWVSIRRNWLSLAVLFLSTLLFLIPATLFLVYNL